MYTIGTRMSICGGLAAAIMFGAAEVRADDVEDIVRALAPTKTRSLSSNTPANPEQAADESFVDSLRDRPTRSLSVEEVNHLDKIVSEHKNVNFETKFAYNSAALSGEERNVAEKMGKVLSHPDLQGQMFLIMGHTDAKGSSSFNQKLSERRADAVKDFLVKKYNVPAEKLVSVGYGESHLKNTKDPNAAENRRVQVVNIMATKSANK
jgi:outer membrane protein OmpA-like peptidoglycan-associated protein